MKAIILGKAERQIMAGIPLLFLAGTAFHFLYQLSGELFFLGLFVPVNESVWEHLKLVLWPMALWWIIGYIVLSRVWELDAPAWFSGALAALLTAQCTIVLLFYFYTGAFGIESLGLDVALFFLAVVLGQAAGLRTYRRGSSLSWFLPLLFLAALLALFVVFTLSPPDLPLFQDPVTGRRGIFQV